MMQRREPIRRTGNRTVGSNPTPSAIEDEGLTEIEWGGILGLEFFSVAKESAMRSQRPNTTPYLTLSSELSGIPECQSSDFSGNRTDHAFGAAERAHADPEKAGFGCSENNFRCRRQAGSSSNIAMQTSAVSVPGNLSCHQDRAVP